MNGDNLNGWDISYNNYLPSKIYSRPDILDMNHIARYVDEKNRRNALTFLVNYCLKIHSALQVSTTSF